jgi:hypothetical protein
MMFSGWGMGCWMMISYGFVVLLFLAGDRCGASRAVMPNRASRAHSDPHCKRAARSTVCTAVRLMTTSAPAVERAGLQP